MIGSDLPPVEKERYHNLSEKEMQEVIKKVPFKMLIEEINRRYYEKDNFFKTVKEQVKHLGLGD